MYRDPNYKAQERASGAEINRLQDRAEAKRLDAKSKARLNASKTLGKAGAPAMTHRPRGY